ncbi:molybdenum cofactor guanylyltransferase MobA [Nitrosophilus alvini]|uniref:molybdenum cofactor guanylyltransferase MobA n=1 Tax=Nitrosophilus alvini TaxID=2714855 RepID=UPI00190B95AB|nr:molybdenum cofactor guanylyltransferase MobA [Nitrosophilus alvini]
MSKLDIPCIIFAGGKSSRMGKDKSLLPFAGFSTLSEYQYRRLSKIFNNVYISAKENKFNFAAPLIKDRDSARFAPTFGILSSFESLNSEFFAISVDTPFVDKEVIKKLIEKAKLHPKKDAVIARTKSGTHPLIGIYRPSIAPKIKELAQKKNFKLNYLLKISNTLFVDFEDEEKFLNLNRPEDYNRAIHLLNRDT